MARGGRPRRVVCITGTKGKSTTTAIAGHLLRGLGYRVVRREHRRAALVDPEAPTDVDHWVIEVSSYQATDVPVVAAGGGGDLAAPRPPALARRRSETYYADKLSLCTRPGADLTSPTATAPCCGSGAACSGPGSVGRRGRRRRDATGPPPLGLLGVHNRRNALIARACLAALGVAEADDDDALAEAAAASSAWRAGCSVGTRRRRGVRRRRPVDQRAAHAGRGRAFPGRRVAS